MSVIVGRALPDVRDGLKPVHRRVLYAMYDGGYRPDRSYSKCTRVVGDVMGSTTRTATPRSTTPWCASPSRGRCATRWSTGRATSARRATTRRRRMRYTECRLAPLAMEMVRDIDEDTVDFGANYDGRTQEPVVLPSRFPNLLVNGSAGIAVGMATNIPPHNLREVAAGVQWLLENPEAAERGAARRADGAGPGPGLPDRRADHGPARHRGRLPHRPRLDHDARRRRGRGDPGPDLPGRHRAAVPGQPRQPGREDRRAGQGRPARRHRRHPRRDLRAHRPAARHRAASATPSPRSC